jgi:hypothetical protein
MEKSGGFRFLNCEASETFFIGTRRRPDPRVTMDKTPVERSDNKMFYTFSETMMRHTIRIKKRKMFGCASSSPLGGFFFSFRLWAKARSVLIFCFLLFSVILLRLVLNIWNFSARLRLWKYSGFGFGFLEQLEVELS